MRHLGHKLMAAAVAAMRGGAPAMAAAPESDEPIKIVMNNWTSQNVLATVTGLLLEKMGYNVEYVPSDGQLQLPSVSGVRWIAPTPTTPGSPATRSSSRS